MLATLADSLACPWDLGPLTPEGAEAAGPSGFRCGRCGRTTPIVDGIWDALGPLPPPRTLAQLTNILPPVARTYESWWRVRSLGLLSRRPFTVAEELAELAAAVGEVAGELVVDVACSEGLYGRHLAHAGATVVAVDHSRAFLRRVQTRCGDEGIAERVVPVRAVAQRLPVGEGRAAAAVMGGSLNEIGDQRAALAECCRVLRPGGRLFSMSLVRASTPAGRAVQRALRPSGIAFPTEAETMDLLPPEMAVREWWVDGIVARVTAEKVG